MNDEPGLPPLQSPPDILRDGLCYVWYTNADKDRAVQSGDHVVDFVSKVVAGAEDKLHVNALIGPPTKHMSEGVGIYRLKP